MATNEERDDAYRAVGRYVVEFSRLVFQMRRQIARRIGASGEPRRLASLALGEATASQIANAFFAICREVADLEAAEEKIVLELSKEVNAAIKTRNDFAHGDWWVGFGGIDGGEDVPVLQRVKPTRRAGAFEEREIPVGDLDQLCDALYTLRQHVAELGDICLADYVVLTDGAEKVAPRVSDLFVLREGLVRREGRLAGASKLRYT